MLTSNEPQAGASLVAHDLGQRIVVRDPEALPQPGKGTLRRLDNERQVLAKLELAATARANGIFARVKAFGESVLKKDLAIFTLNKDLYPSDKIERRPNPDGEGQINVQHIGNYEEATSCNATLDGKETPAMFLIRGFAYARVDPGFEKADLIKDEAGRVIIIKDPNDSTKVVIIDDNYVSGVLPSIGVYPISDKFGSPLNLDLLTVKPLAKIHVDEKGKVGYDKVGEIDAFDVAEEVLGFLEKATLSPTGQQRIAPGSKYL